MVEVRQLPVVDGWRDPVLDHRRASFVRRARHAGVQPSAEQKTVARSTLSSGHVRRWFM
jgi:hypothetical protein